MNYPVQATLMHFAKICDEKSEIPFFSMGNMNSFFCEVEKDYPNIFENATEDSRENEIDSFRTSGIIKSIAPHYHPHFISPGMSKAWFIRHKDEYKVYEKEIKEIAKRFYDEAGCNLEGKLGKRTVILNSKSQ